MFQRKLAASIVTLPHPGAVPPPDLLSKVSELEDEEEERREKKMSVKEEGEEEEGSASSLV